MNRSFSFNNLDVHYIDSIGPVVDVFKVSVSESPIIACDLETTGLDPLNHQISLIGIGVAEQRQLPHVIVDLAFVDQHSQQQAKEGGDGAELTINLFNIDYQTNQREGTHHEVTHHETVQHCKRVFIRKEVLQIEVV